MYTTALLALLWTLLVNAKFSTLPLIHDQRESNLDDIHNHDKRSFVNQDVFSGSAPFWYTYMDIGECTQSSFAAELSIFCEVHDYSFRKLIFSQR